MPDEDDHSEQEKPHDPPTVLGGGGSASAGEREQAAKKSRRYKLPWPKKRPEWLRVPKITTAGWSLFFAGVVAVATAAYLAVSLLMWWENRKTVELTRQALELARRDSVAAQRPWIGSVMISAPVPEPLPGANEDEEIIIALSNSGSSPALKGSAVISYGTFRMPPDLFSATEMVETEGPKFIGADQAIEVATGKVKALSVDDLEKVRDGQAMLTVWGTYSYQDWLGNSYELTFCYHYRLEKLHWSACSYYNSST